jgi:hypothetical protein
MIALPSDRNSVCSRATTVSAQPGIGSPVSTQANAVAAITSPAAAGPAIAMPSIAAQSQRGDGHRARTGSARTRSHPSATCTSSGTGQPRQPATAHASVHRA